MTDDELIQQYVNSGSQEALGKIVGQHIDWVYSAARRQVHDPQTAEDVTQAVFIVLAKKAKSLVGRGSLAGWLMRTTHFAARDAIKKEARRKHHEREAAMIRSDEQPTPVEPFTEDIDAALAQLSADDRSALTLRYLKEMSTNETAEALSISTDAAAKRITRAVARLRRILLHRGAIVSSFALPEALNQLPRLVAPSHLAGAVTAAATGGAASTAGFSIAKGVSHMLTYAKLKAASLLIGAILFTVGAGVGGVKILADDTTPTPPPPPAPAPGQVVINPTAASAQLANGVSIEIVGICEHSSPTAEWWDAGGAVQQTRPYTRMETGGFSGDPAFIQREFAIKVSDQVVGSPDRASVRWGFNKASGSMGGSTVGGSRGLEGEIESLPDTPGGATLHASVAAGKWTTLVTDNSGGSMSMSTGKQEFVFSEPFRVNDETHIVVAALGLSDLDTRLLIIEKNGREHVASIHSSASSENGMVCEFGGKFQLNSIRECRFQTRPFDQWIEIRNVSLHAGQVTDVQTATSDDAKK